MLELILTTDLFCWALGLIDLLEPFTWLVVFSLLLLAAMEVNIVLPAVLGLVCVGETRIKRRAGVVLDGGYHIRVLRHGDRPEMKSNHK